MTPQSPRAARSTRKHFEDAVRTSPKSVVTTSALWVAGKGGCGTLEILPKEIRQKIYGYAFDISTPITVKKCCGPEATIRERRACRKHGTGATTKASRFNMLQVSKAMSSEALWVVRSQGSLHLEVDRALTQYLGCYRWNGQRQFLTSRLGCKRKMTMWASAGKYRHVEVAICKETLLDGNPVIHTNYLVDIASSLCQSWLQTSSINATAADSDVKRTVKVKLGSLFQDVLPFNTKPYGATSSWELNEWMYRYYLLSNSEPDLDKIAADSGHNLLRLVAVIAKYRGCSQWEIVANTQLHKDDKVGLGWLHVIQAECARHGMCLEDAGSE
ncbi:hypothetical protein EKO04_008266 [Ascochyta lentis]|uniref:Uncharacterized protein n=1 Tax=Ascochyta lentis TaxID=205686 RepID=A0A8H7IZN0_9PLEO|nr:hypothetical protein EKO04_008266 [Ascochyta lentis]